MSAFICGPDHFKVLAIFAASRGSYGLNVDPRYVDGLSKLADYNPSQLASAYGDIMYAENTRSVLTRYPEDDEESAPGPINKPKNIRITARDMISSKYRLPAVAILKMCNCLAYQSCETKDWEQTPAFRLVQAIKEAAIRQLPGYEDAPWDYYADEQKAA